MARSSEDHALVRRRQHARVDLLKRRIGLASVLGFAAFFGLAAQHAMKSSSSGKTVQSAAARSTSTTPATFFDQTSSRFSFGSESTGSLPSALQSAAPSSSPPVAQTSVS